MSLSPINQKAHDIAHAAFRVAKLIGNEKLRAELESSAIEFLASVPTGNVFDNAICFAKIEAMEKLVSLAVSIGEMKPINGEVLLRELHNIQTAIEVHSETAKAIAKEAKGVVDVDISNMFTPTALATEPIKKATMKDEVQEVPAERTPDPKLKINPKFSPSPFSPINSNSKVYSTENPEKPESEEDISARQSTILKYIRTIPFCRLRNIMENMPDVSERTIRNDIQGLIDKQLVRRIGGGGPNSYFETMELTIRSRV